MNAAPQPLIRPPWPDELSRVWKFLGGSRRMKGRVHPRIAVIGEPERIVAAAALQIERDKVGLLHLSLRTRFCAGGHVTADLLRTAVEIARSEGLREVAVILPEAAPWRSSLEAAGFVCQRTDEWWAGRRNAQIEARMKTAARLVRSPRLASGLTVGPLTEDDIPAVRAIAEEHGLATFERLGNERILGEITAEYAPELSAVVRRDGEVAGVLLVKASGNRVYIHVRAVAKKDRVHSSAINAHFFAWFAQPAYRHATHFLFSAQPGVDKETIAMAKRCGAEKIAGYCYYRKTMGG